MYEIEFVNNKKYDMIINELMKVWNNNGIGLFYEYNLMSRLSKID